MSKGGPPIWYTVYDPDGDKLVAMGWACECAAYMGRTVNAFWSLVSRVKSGKNRGYTIVAENLETGSYAVYGTGNKGRWKTKGGHEDGADSS